MIKLDLSKAVNKSAIIKFHEKIERIAQGIDRFETEGNEFLGWKDLPTNYNKAELIKMEEAAKKLIKDEIEVLVVIGIGGSYLGAKAGLDMVKGFYDQTQKMEIMFLGNSVSATDLSQKLAYLDSKKFAVNIISKSGTTTEPALAFRMIRKMLEEKVGRHNARDYIFATTDANKGLLLTMSLKEEYTRFVIPDDIGGRFSVLTPVGLFPLLCAGLDAKKILEGAQMGQKMYSKETIYDNDAYQYAVARYILSKRFKSEMLVSYEPQLAQFQEWWKQLFGESEGKNNKGLLPTSAVFSTDLHSLGQFIQEGKKILFETVITVEEPNSNVKIVADLEDMDELSYLEGKTIHEINNIAFKAVTDAHVLVGKVPNIHLEIGKMDEYHFGQLVYFFQRACTMSAYLLGVNPFTQPGVEVYKQNMFKALGKNKRK